MSAIHRNCDYTVIVTDDCCIIRARSKEIQISTNIIERRDLLVPQDIRERKGAFFTPRKWVELSQKYLTDYLGQNWQDDYYIWDCAAGTGNLLAGLTNKYKIYASTLDQADISVMHERIDGGCARYNQSTGRVATD